VGGLQATTLEQLRGGAGRGGAGRGERLQGLLAQHPGVALLSVFEDPAEHAPAPRAAPSPAEAYPYPLFAAVQALRAALARAWATALYAFPLFVRRSTAPERPAALACDAAAWASSAFGDPHVVRAVPSPPRCRRRLHGSMFRVRLVV